MKRIDRWLWLLIAVAGVLVYSNSLWVPFQFDDYGVIVDNPGINRSLPMPESRGVGYWLHSRSVVDATFRINYAVGGLNVEGYHLLNVLIHVLNGLLLFGIVRRTLEKMVYGSWLSGGRDQTGADASSTMNHSPREARSAKWGQPSTIALAVALLWVVHPLNTQAVTYISQRYESLMALCFMLTLYGFVRGVTAPNPRWWFNLAVGSCLLGMGTKQIMATAPVMVLLYDCMFVGPTLKDVLRKRWRVHVALLATLGVLVALEISFMGSLYQRGAYRVASVSAGSYLLTQAEVIPHYLRLAVVPHPLCFDYAWPVVSGLGAVLVPGLLLLVAFLVSAWGVVRRVPWAYLSMGIFVLLAPSSSVMPLDDMAFEHRMYLPLMAVVALAVLGCWGLLERVERRSRDEDGAAGGVGTLLLIVVVSLFAWRTVVRNEDYRTEESLWKAVVAKQSHNLRAWNHVAKELSKRGELDEALLAYGRVLDATQDVAAGAPYHNSLPANSKENNRMMAFANRGLLLYQHGRYPEAIESYRAAIGMFPYRVDVFHKLEGAYVATGISVDEARRKVSQLVQLKRERRAHK